MFEDSFSGLVGSKPNRNCSYPETKDNLPRGFPKLERPSGNEYMFLEDVQHQTLPYGRGPDEGFEITISQDSKELNELIVHALSSTSRSISRLEDAFRSFTERSLFDLVKGRLILEIDMLRPQTNLGSEPKAFRINHLDPDLLVSKFGRINYWTESQSNSDTSAKWSKEKLDHKTLVIAKIPKSLSRDLRRALKIYKLTNQNFVVINALIFNNSQHQIGFDFNKFRKMSHEIVLRETRNIGWSGRGQFSEDLLDPAKVWRAIQFARLCVNLRDITIFALQQAIDIASKEIGFTATIELTKVVTTADLDKMEIDLESGNTPISEMFIPKYR